MKKLLEGMFLFILFSGYFAYKNFVPDLFDPLFYDICSQSYIDQKIEKGLKRAEGSKIKSIEFQKIRQKIATLEIPDNEIDGYIKTLYSYGYLLKNSCPIPPDLEDKFFSAINPQKADSVYCKKDKFLLQSKRTTMNLKNQRVITIFLKKEYIVSLLKT